jgi:pilus assembly protein TadC
MTVHGPLSWWPLWRWRRSARRLARLRSAINADRPVGLEQDEGQRSQLWWRDPLRRSTVRADRELRQELPAALGLLAAALRGGSPPSQALEAVGRALTIARPGIRDGRSMGHLLCQVSASLRLGGDIRSAWASVPQAQPGRPLAAMALALARLDEGGAPVAVALTGLSADLRAEQRTASIAAARRAGVLAVLPLGLCFLPAFVLIAVLPVVVGAARQVLGS